MKKKGRPPKKHQPINASFDEVLGVISRSHYADKKTIEAKQKKDKK